MQLIVSNPPKRKRRHKNRSSTVATKKKRRRRGGGGFGGFVRKARRGSRRGFADGFSLGKAAMLGVTAGASAIGVNILVNKLSDGANPLLPESMRTGYGRAATKAGLGLLLGFAARKMGLGKHALAIAAGGVTVAAMDVYAQSQAQRGIGGVDYFNVGGGVQGYPQLVDAYGQPQYQVA